MPARLVPIDLAPPIVIDHEETMLIGRASDCNVRIRSSWVSRHHCRVALSDAGLIIRDLGSVNGTFGNCKRVKETVLHSHDELWIGNVRYMVALEGSTCEAAESTRTGWEIDRNMSRTEQTEG